MIPIKIQCGCGQRYAFDVEPVNGFMPTNVACPTCGVDGTTAANEMIAQALAAHAPAMPPPIPKAHPAKTPARAVTPSRPAPLAVPKAPPPVASEFNMGLGILGACLGAGLGMIVMYVFFELAGFRFPWLGIGIGVLTGYGAKILSKGTSTTLGVFSSIAALASIVATMLLMFGSFPITSVISAAICVSIAYRIVSA